MRLGVIGTYGTTDQLVELAVEAERAGWDGFFTWDGISVGEIDTFDPWVLLGAIAQRTGRIRLGAMVFSLPRRKPWEVARQSLTVDHLSKGRLVVPVGLGAVDDGGYSRVSGEVTSARDRADRLDEVLAVLERAWSGEPVHHDGVHHRVDGLVFRPTPVQRPRIPVWVVGAWPAERSMARAARWDGILPQRRADAGRPLAPDELAEVTDWVRRRRAEEGRTGPFDVVVEGVLPDDDAEARERLAELERAGVTWWVESRWDPERDTPEALLDRVRRGPPR